VGFGKRENQRLRSRCATVRNPIQPGIQSFSRHSAVLGGQ
jgi:hypothetical protein